MNQQRHAHFGHCFEHREDCVDARNARVRVGRCASRVQLGGVNKPTGFSGANVFGLCSVSQIEHHQRLEAATCRASSQNALTVGVCFGCITHRRHQVRHDDGAAKSARNIRDSVRQHSTISKMYMPVVGTEQGQAVRHWGFQAGQTEANATGKDSLRHSLSSFVSVNRYL